MEVKKVRPIHCPYCMKVHQHIRNGDEEMVEKVTCPYCKKEIDLKALGVHK